MGPIVKETSSKYEGKSIEFVKFDFTSTESKAAAEADARRLGVEELYAQHAPKTGFALLVDAENKTVITRLSARQDVAQWSTEIDKAFAAK